MWGTGTPPALYWCAGVTNDHFERKSEASELAGPQRGREVEISLQAAVDQHCGVTGADGSFALAPQGECGNLLAQDCVKTFNKPEIDSYQAHSAAIALEVGGQIMQASKGLEMLRGKPPVVYWGRNQHPVRNRLGSNSCHHRPPIIQGEL